MVTTCCSFLYILSFLLKETKKYVIVGSVILFGISITRYKMAMIPEIHFVNRLVRTLVNIAVATRTVVNVTNSIAQTRIWYGFQIFN